MKSPVSGKAAATLFAKEGFWCRFFTFSCEYFYALPKILSKHIDKTRIKVYTGSI